MSVESSASWTSALLPFATLPLESQVTIEKLTESTHIKHRRDSERPLTETTIEFTCNLAATDSDVCAGVNAP